MYRVVAVALNRQPMSFGLFSMSFFSSTFVPSLCNTGLKIQNQLFGPAMYNNNNVFFPLLFSYYYYYTS